MQNNLDQAEREEKIKALNREIEHITARNGMHKIEQLHEIQMADARFELGDFWSIIKALQSWYRSHNIFNLNPMINNLLRKMG